MREKLIVYSGANNNSFLLWSDLTSNEIYTVQGILMAWELITNKKHRIEFDPRYNFQELIKDLESLAAEKEKNKNEQN